MRSVAIAVVITLFALGHGGAAAEFTLSDPYYMGDRMTSATVHVDGEILPGDLKELVGVLSVIDGFEEGFWDGGTVLSLNSPGGSYLEGIEIGRMVRDKGIGTRVPDGAGCYSACAIVFMHGTSKADGEEWLNRRLHPKGLLGFHAPYLVLPEEIVPSRAMVEASYSAAMTSIAALVESAGHIFSEELLMKMLMTPADEMLMARTVGDVLLWDIALDGAPQPLTSLTYSQMVMACQTRDELERDLRPSITAARAIEVVDGGYGPKLLGVSDSGDEIYRYSISEMNSVGCNLGVRRNEDGSVSVRYYGTSYGNEPLPQRPSWMLGSLYFTDPTTPIATR